jgi:hypothetical protein
VKEIIGHKLARGRSAFLVVWRDYPGEESWEPFCVVSRLDAFRDYCRSHKIVARTKSIRFIKEKEPAPAPAYTLYKDDEITEEDPDSDIDSVAKVRLLPLSPHSPPRLLHLLISSSPTDPEAHLRLLEKRRGQSMRGWGRGRRGKLFGTTVLKRRVMEHGRGGMTVGPLEEQRPRKR